MIKAIIIEDESLIARLLQSKITSVADDIQIVEVLPSLKTAKRWFLNNNGGWIALYNPTGQVVNAVYWAGLGGSGLGDDC